MKTRRRRLVLVAVVGVVGALIAEAYVVGQRLHAFEARISLEGVPDRLEFSADGSLLLIRSKFENYAILDVENPFDVRWGARRSRSGEAVYGRLSPDGRSLLRCENYTTRHQLVLTDLAAARDTWCSGDAAGWTYSFSSDGRRLVYWSWDDFFHVCRVPDGQEELRLKRFDVRDGTGPPAPAFSPDGKTIAIAGRGEVLIEDATRDHTIRTLATPASFRDVTCVRFSPDGHVLVAVWDDAPDAMVIDAWDTATGAPLWTSAGRYGRAVEFTRDGSSLLSIDQGRLEAVNVRNGRRLGTSAASAVSVFALSPDGESIALGREGGKIEIASLRAVFRSFDPPIDAR
jgi:WD40 repeat protein